MHCCRQVYLPNAASKLGITRISGILFARVGSLGGESTGEHGGEGGAIEHASERANERARLSSTGEVVCERDTVAAAAVGLAPDVKFLCCKAQLYFTF